MTKRSFFKSIMGAVAAVALAPEIAFGVKLKMPGINPQCEYHERFCRATLAFGERLIVENSQG